MINWLRRKKKVAPRKFQVLEIESAAIGQYLELLDQVFKEEVEGVVIRNFLQKEEVATLLAAYRQIPKEELIQPNEGIYTYPKTFVSVNQELLAEEDIKKFYRESVAFWKGFEAQMGLDLVAKVKTLLSTLSNGKKVEVPLSVEGDSGAYQASTFRQLMAEAGELKLHCGRMFHERFPAFYEHLKSISDIYHQLSYFITLQTALKGGRLKVYPVRWDEASEKTGELTVQTKDGRSFELESDPGIEGCILDLKPGDLFLFKGATYWHLVEKVEGAVDRITFGSFISSSLDGESIHIWS
jgi:hypothetical protein